MSKQNNRRRKRKKREPILMDGYDEPFVKNKYTSKDRCCNHEYCDKSVIYHCVKMNCDSRITGICPCVSHYCGKHWYGAYSCKRYCRYCNKLDHHTKNCKYKKS